MVHPAKAHNVAAVLVEMYGEAINLQLQEIAQLRAKLKQVEDERDQTKKLLTLVRRDRDIDKRRVEDLESSLCAARQGAIHAADVGQQDAEPTEGDGGVHGLQDEVADDVRDGPREDSHSEVRPAASASGSVEAGAEGEEELTDNQLVSVLTPSGKAALASAYRNPPIEAADLVRVCKIKGCPNMTTTGMCDECADVQF